MIDELEQTGRLVPEQVARWREAAALLAVFDVIAQDGANAMVKADGDRSDTPSYTVVVSGGKLGEAFFRKDGSDLVALVREGISFYRSRVWGRT